MKIMHVIDSGGLYGAEVMLLNLMTEQVKLGMEPVLASIGQSETGEKPLEREARRRGVAVKPVRMSDGPNFLGALEILRWAKRERVRVIHSHGYKGNILFGLLPRSIRGLPVVSTVHGWTCTRAMSRMAAYQWLDAVSLRRLDRVVLVSGVMQRHPRLAGCRRALEVVPNGISAPPVDGGELAVLDGAILSFCRKGYTLGAIGRLSREKGFGLLLDALAGLIAEGRDVRLVILGEGGQRPELEQKARTLGIDDRVLLPGYVADAREYLPHFRQFVMSSLTEGLPMVLLEAMQAAVPVVATRVGGIPEVLENGRSGTLVEAGSAQALQEGIREVLENPAGAAVLVEAASRRVGESYSSRAMAERYGDIYRQVLQ